MNCKPGDLAFMARSDAGNEGRVVRCLTLTHAVYVSGSGPAWFTEPMLKNVHGQELPTFDSYLRPIRAPGITDSEVSELFSPSPAKESEKV